jgi:HEAT repeat protein
MAKELDSPDVATRIRALETWAQSAPPGAVDPLIAALDDNDERVQARAMELIDQDWARTADAEQSGEGAEDTNGIAGSEDTDMLPERSASNPVNQ